MFSHRSLSFGFVLGRMVRMTVVWSGVCVSFRFSHITSFRRTRPIDGYDEYDSQIEKLISYA